MPAEKSDAIVLRVSEFSETSCIATLFTREFGKVTGLAKGARRRKSAFESALDVLSLVSLVFLRKNTGGLDLLTEARLERRFRSAATSLGAWYAGLYLVELLAAFCEAHDPHPNLHDAAADTLGRLDSGCDTPGIELLRFEFRLLREVGHAPMLDACCGCANGLPAAARQPFGLLAGGLLCPRCRPGQMQVVSLSHDAVSLAQNLSGQRVHQPDCLPSGENNPAGLPQKGLPKDPGRPPAPNVIYAELRGLVSQFESSLLGYKPASQAWLKQV